MIEPPFLSRKRINKRLEMLRVEREPHIRDFQDITDFIRPSRGRYLYKTEEESKRPTRVINGSPAIASRTLRSGLLAGVSSPSYPWFKMKFKGDEELSRWGPARIYLEMRERALYRVLAGSNFYNVFQTGYGDAGDFGNMAVIMDGNPRSVLSCYACSPGEYFFGQNAEGDVDTLYREFTMTVGQLVNSYGRAVSYNVMQKYNAGDYDTRIQVIHAIEPNIEQDREQRGWMRMPYISVMLEKAADGIDPAVADEHGQPLLEVKGYEVWPVPNLRWDIASGNIYGDGPGLMALGDAKALQTIERRKAQGIDKMVTPPLQGPPQLKNSPVSHVPGGITFVDPHLAGSGQAIRELYAVSPHAITVIQSEIYEHERRIDEAYFKDLFLLLATTDRREITAREVEEKHEEKLLALGPMLQRTHRDALDNAINRADFLAAKAGMYPPPPKELADRDLEIEYISTLAHAQRSVNIGALERLFGFAGQVGGVYQSALKKLDPMAAIDEYADAVAAPARVIVPTDIALKSAEQEAAAAQQQQTLETAVPAAKLLSETDVKRPSALTEILRRGGVV